MDAFLHALQLRLDERASANLTRVYRSNESPMGPRLTIGGESLLCFSSNDYLGLANHPKVKESVKAAVNRYGVSGGASHAVCGHSAAHELLEATFAEALGRDDALFFTNGYMANLAVMSSFLEAKDAVFEDKWNHASLLDSGLLSKAKFQRFLHNDIGDLERRLNKTTARHSLICADSVFSMDGDLFNVERAVPLATRQGALLFLDDAHGFGVLGEKGHGIVDYASLTQGQLPLVMVTLGKALGCFGAVLVGHKVLIETLRQFARTYIYTTSLPPALAVAAKTSFDLLHDEAFRRNHLHRIIRYFKKEAALLGLNLFPSDTPIQPLLVGDAEEAMSWQYELREKGFLVSAIRPPTVPAGSSRLRITLSAAHSFDDVEQLLFALQSIQKSKFAA